jgi:hypothetical protein
MVVGCGSSSSGGDTPASTQGGGGSTGTGGSGTGAGGGGTGGTATAACMESGAIDLAGLWAVKVRLDVSLQSAPSNLVAVCPMDQKGPSELLVLVEIAQDGTVLPAITTHICDFNLPSVTAMAGGCVGSMPGSVTAQVSPSTALRAALPGTKLPPVKGTLSGTAPGATFNPERVNVVLGSKSPDGKGMAHWNPSTSCDNSAAPKGTDTMCETSCVSSCDDAVDTDGDTAPGVTVTVCGQSQEAAGAMCHPDDPMTPGWTLQGKAYLNFSVNPLLNGVVKSSCQIDGSGVDAAIDYDVIGGDVWLSGAQISVGQIISAIPTFKVVPESSKYTALRVDGKHGAPNWALDVSNLKAACDTAAKHAKSAF